MRKMKIIKPERNNTSSPVFQKMKRITASILTIIIAVSMSTPLHVNAAMQDVVYERVVAHGGGIINGYDTTNSKEAVENAISNGFKNIELDLALSSDGKVIAMHDWESQCMSYFGVADTSRVTADAFSDMLIFGQFHTLTFDDIANLLRTYKGLRIITDTKEDNYTILSIIAAQYPDVIEQVYPQAFSYDEYSLIEQLGYKRIILTLYKMSCVDAFVLSNFALSHPSLYAVTMDIALKDNGFCQQLMNNGIVVYTHTVNNYEQTLQNRPVGCFGVYSDTLIPGDFSDFNMKYYPVITSDDGSYAKITDIETTDGKFKINIASKAADKSEFVQFLADGQALRVDDGAGNLYNNYPVNTDGYIWSEDIPEGISSLEIKVYNTNSVLIGSRSDYCVRKSGDSIRIVSRIFRYRLEHMKDIQMFESVIGGEDIRVREILSRSFIAKAGESIYYNNALAGIYKYGGDAIFARTSCDRTAVPLALTANDLGFSSVTMDIYMRLWLVSRDKTATLSVGGTSVDMVGTAAQISAPVVLYNNRSYAPIELFGLMTDRQAIDSEGISILLPEGETADAELSRKLTEAAVNLFSE